MEEKPELRTRKPIKMKLTEKDIQVLDLLKTGMGQKQIGDNLNVTEDSISKRLERARIRNNCTTTVQLVALYMSENRTPIEHASSCTLVHANTSA